MYSKQGVRAVTKSKTLHLSNFPTLRYVFIKTTQTPFWAAKEVVEIVLLRTLTKSTKSLLIFLSGAAIGVAIAQTFVLRCRRKSSRERTPTATAAGLAAARSRNESPGLHEQRKLADILLQRQAAFQSKEDSVSDTLDDPLAVRSTITGDGLLGLAAPYSFNFEATTS